MRVPSRACEGQAIGLDGNHYYWFICKKGCSLDMGLESKRYSLSALSG